MLTGLLFGQDVLYLKSGELKKGVFIEKIDNDIVFTVADFELLYKFDKDVMSGLYIMANDRQFAAVEYWDEDYFQKHGTFEFLNKEDIRTRYIPFKVEYVGFGFLLFKDRKSVV